MKNNNLQDIALLEKYLNEGNLTEVKKILEKVFSRDLTDEEKGESYVLLASSYLKVMNDLNRWYKEILNNLIKRLEKIDKLESETEDRIILKETRQLLKDQ